MKILIALIAIFASFAANALTTQQGVYSWRSTTPTSWSTIVTLTMPYSNGEWCADHITYFPDNTVTPGVDGMQNISSVEIRRVVNGAVEWTSGPLPIDRPTTLAIPNWCNGQFVSWQVKGNVIGGAGGALDFDVFWIVNHQ